MTLGERRLFKKSKYRVKRMPEQVELKWSQLLQWFGEFYDRFAPFFFRHEVRSRSGRYLQTLFQPLERKTGWQMAEAMGEHDPNGAQRLLYQAIWDEEAVRDELERLVAEQFGDAGDGTFVLDESGFPKKGKKSVGVQRQYCGAVGKIENCQIGVFLSYVSPKGYTLLDRRLYLPQHGWADNPARRQEAGVPEEIPFQTKPQLAKSMLEHACALGVPGRWVTGDEVYGGDPKLREWLELQSRPYVLGIRKSEPLETPPPKGPIQVTAAELTKQVPSKKWKRLSAGDGAKGKRLYDWAWVRLHGPSQEGWSRWLLVRRSLAEPAELAYYLVFAPRETTQRVAVRVAGSRWTVERCFEEAKGEAGLDEYEVRSWRSWHRHITLSMMAHTFLAWARARAAEVEPAPSRAAGKKNGSAR